MTSKSKLKLHITGRTPKSERTISNLYGICDEQLEGQCEIEIIDVLEHPQVAEDKKIMAVPTLENCQDLRPFTEFTLSEIHQSLRLFRMARSQGLG